MDIEELKNLLDAHIEGQTDARFFSLALSRHDAEAKCAKSTCILGWNKAAEEHLQDGSGIGHALVAAVGECCEDYLLAHWADPVKSYKELLDNKRELSTLRERVQELEKILEQAPLYYRAYSHDQRMHGNDESSTAHAAKKAPEYAAWLKDQPQ